MDKKEEKTNLEKLNSELKKLEAKYMNDIAELERNSKIDDKSISEPERDVYEWKDTRSSAEKKEEKVYEDSAKGELLQQIDETRDPREKKKIN